jgi:phosphoribosylglycinamide formyltransferase-1
MKGLAIFSSGAGSNAARIIDHFRDHPSIRVRLIGCNNPTAGVLTIASTEHIPSLLIEKDPFFRGSAYIPELHAHQIDFIVLAGFLWKIPRALVQAFPQRIVNIHPALLPKYGGKGMYGRHVHEAVIAAGEKESGITIHYVDELYDHGQAIFQEKVIVDPGDTPETLAKKVQYLEHAHFSRVVEAAVSASPDPAPGASESEVRKS